jgi:cytochrome c-type biogenesis protein CcsB
MTANLLFSISAVLCFVCLAGMLVGAVSNFVTFRAAGAGGGSFGFRLERGTSLLVGLTCAIGLAAVVQKGFEVNHFPSQTMQETVLFFCALTLIMVFALRWVLRLHLESSVECGVWQLVVGLSAAGIGASMLHALSLSSAARDLPPALDSYWFAPHITCLLVSYGTLGIAAIFGVVYFAMSVARGKRFPHYSKRRTTAIVALMLLVPFVHFVTAPILLICLAIGRMNGLHLQERAWIDTWGRRAEELGFRIFSVGFPFLTAGLMQGAYWAQEAWANYWGWDSKEVTALISWFIYIAYFHLRYVAGLRGDRSMGVLASGAASVFLTFQLFGYLPDSMKSMHRYTDPTIAAQEGQQGLSEDRFISDEAPTEPIARSGQ